MSNKKVSLAWINRILNKPFWETGMSKKEFGEHGMEGDHSPFWEWQCSKLVNHKFPQGASGFDDPGDVDEGELRKEELRKKAEEEDEGLHLLEEEVSWLAHSLFDEEKALDDAERARDINREGGDYGEGIF